MGYRFLSYGPILEYDREAIPSQINTEYSYNLINKTEAPAFW